MRHSPARGQNASTDFMVSAQGRDRKIIRTSSDTLLYTDPFAFDGELDRVVINLTGEEAEDPNVPGVFR